MHRHYGSVMLIFLLANSELSSRSKIIEFMNSFRREMTACPILGVKSRYGTLLSLRFVIPNLKFQGTKEKVTGHVQIAEMSTSPFAQLVTCGSVAPPSLLKQMGCRSCLVPPLFTHLHVYTLRLYHEALKLFCPYRPFYVKTFQVSLPRELTIPTNC